MKILFLGDYSNLHNCLATELKSRGHKVTLVSDRGGFQQTGSDIFLSRQPGIIGSVKYLYDIFDLLPSLAGYDVVQLINPHFFDLRPGKLHYLFNRIRRTNGSVWLTMCGNDPLFVQSATDTKTFRYSEYRIGSERTPFVKEDLEREYGWLSSKNLGYCTEVYEHISGAMAVLPEYHIAGRQYLGDRCVFTNIPLDLQTHPYTDFPDFSDGLKIAVGMKRGMEAQKGTDILLKTAQEIANESGGKITVDRVSDLAYKDYLRTISGYHIVLDQLYAYSPATNALDTMALGRVAASGAEDEYYSLTGEATRPIIPLSPLITDLKEHLTTYFNDHDRLVKMAKQGRETIEKHNDVKVVASKFESQWMK